MLYSTHKLSLMLTAYTTKIMETRSMSADDMLTHVYSQPESPEKTRDATWLTWYCNAWDRAFAAEEMRRTGVSRYVEKLADAFSYQIREAFTAEEIEEMRQFVRTDGTTGRQVQDMADANQLMLDAAETLNIAIFDADDGETMSELSIELINRAWAFAEKTGFRY